MNKDIYLKELKNRLSLLNTVEVEAIASMYSDFLDRKLEEGYTNEEALEHLGNVNQVARTILESYKISDKYIKMFVGKERIIDDINEFTNKVADSSIDVLNKIESSAKSVFKKSVQFGENRVNDVKKIFNKSDKKDDSSQTE